MASPIAVILTDASRKILWTNDDFKQITGYTLPEIIGRKPSLLQGENSDPDTIKRLRKSLEAQVPFKDEILNYRKNGEEYLCKLVVHPIFDDAQQLTNFIAFEVDGDAVTDEEIDSELTLLALDEKYRSSSLRGTDGAKLFAELKYKMETEQWYLQSDLGLKYMADALNTNTKYLSQVVNFHTRKNLQYFINSFRVEAAKAKMLGKEYENLTLYGIAMQCGFKNKSTFYRVFKDFMGQTPLAYLKQKRKD